MGLFCLIVYIVITGLVISDLLTKREQVYGFALAGVAGTHAFMWLNELGLLWLWLLGNATAFSVITIWAQYRNGITTLILLTAMWMITLYWTVEHYEQFSR